MNAARVYWLLIVACVQLGAHAASAQDKRAPMGFVGMRGKKFLLDDPDVFKRKPQYHFIGVKGKKDRLELDPEGIKRAPTGFLGMRGKKDLDSYFLPPLSSPELYDGTGYFRGKIDYSPVPMLEEQNQLRDYQLNELLERLRSSAENEVSEPESAEDDMSNAINKRAAKMNQFYGVRGKKAGQPFEANFRGRFIAVRGKRGMDKDGQSNGAQEIKFLLEQNGPWPKRKAQMGFFGVRGKKWTDEPSYEEEQEQVN